MGPAVGAHSEGKGERMGEEMPKESLLTLEL